MLLSWSAKNPIVRDGLNVLSKYGTDAHCWIPGIGYINGLSAGNYLDSAGTTAASVDGLIGRMNDAAQTLGAELVSPLNLQSGWTASSATIVDADTFTTAGAGGVYKNVFESGKTYTITVAGDTTGGVEFRTWDGVTQTIQLSGFGTATFQVPTGQVRLYMRQASAGTTNITSISVREVIGIHATQATAGNKPTLRFADGKFYAEFNGTTNYMSLSAVPFQFADDFCEVFSGSVSDLAAVCGFSLVGSTTTGARSPMMYSAATTGVLITSWKDNAGVSVITTNAAVTANENFVYGARKVGNSVASIKNNEAAATGSVATLGATTVDVAHLGWGGITYYLKGKGGCWIKIKGTVTDADWLTLRRFAGLFNSVSF